ncbi:phosphopantothenoylcysteine decarboxylase isoform X4 [Hyaena hyaena]|uniref:phosphopantothenoylcysteine decarboxylase isoform X4 n=1 Tax=Hyaena hyaena TaxID=95912 RepID=UPI001925010E|nr:phosphopantothenoylcysteine decarboxylase isoform X4 [Hyaena hyaena]
MRYSKPCQSPLEASPGSLPGVEAIRPHMESSVSCPAAAAPVTERPFRVLVGVTGSVAALKLPLLVSRLLDIPGMWKCRSDPVLHIDLRRWADLMLVAPLDANTLGKVASGVCDNLLYVPQWRSLVLRLREIQRDLCMGVEVRVEVAGPSPSSQTCVIRAWDCRKPLLFCPAMNTAMWKHPITAQQVGLLKAFGYVEIPCVAKKLVCGDEGLGAMAEVGTIVDKVKEVLFWHGGSQQS